MKFFTKLKISFFCQKVGIDSFCNKYYESKKGKKKKRFVIYSKIEDSSRVPAQWHSWLHYTSDETPSENNNIKNAWQKAHLPNLTGTKFIYSSLQYQNKYREKHYQSWNPNKI
jgi:NADH:ubiquinone oxidoreductase subunit